jgi:hypothetical protein
MPKPPELPFEGRLVVPSNLLTSQSGFTVRFQSHRSAGEWRQNDGEHYASLTTFEQKLALMLTERELVHEGRSWTQPGIPERPNLSGASRFGRYTRNAPHRIAGGDHVTPATNRRVLERYVKALTDLDLDAQGEV